MEEIVLDKPEIKKKEENNSVLLPLEEEPTGCGAKREHRWNVALPCLKFVIAAGLSISSFVIGCTMVITSKENDPLIPFYSSLITGAISVWVNVPRYDGKPEKG